MKENIISYDFKISRNDRSKQKGHNAFLLWFTGLSGSGKSTISSAVEQLLFQKGVHTYTLDGDNLRGGLNSDLSFTPEDRTENIRRVSEVSKLFIDAGIVVLAAFVSPYKKDRENIKNIIKGVNFVEIFVNTSIEECEKRDTKGLYKKARAGEIKNMTGISAPYEKPEHPDLELLTENETVEESAKKVVDFILNKLKLQNE